MLKIKDNVDLKTLEKYHFKKENEFYMIKEFTTNFHEGEGNNSLLIYYSSRQIVLDIMNNDYTYHIFDDELGRIEDTIYDLIKDELVEKVVTNE